MKARFFASLVFLAVAALSATVMVTASNASNNGVPETTAVAQEAPFPLLLYMGGHARELQALEGLIDFVPDENVDQIIRIDIKQDENYRYYFESDAPLVVQAGKTVKFVVYNTHFTPDECW